MDNDLTLNLKSSKSYSSQSSYSYNPKMKRLVDQLKADNYITKTSVYNAMLQTDRGDYINPMWAYKDSPQSIDYNVTISAPHMHAFALDYLADYMKPGDKVLDVGSGSGYLCTAFSKLMEDKGTVVGIEHISDLVEFSITNISKSNKKLLDDKKIILEVGDGRKGFKAQAPFNAIHVGAAAEEVPKDLIDQLARGGRLLIPVGKGSQYIYLIDKDINGKVTQQRNLGVRYVPLTSKESQVGSWK